MITPNARSAMARALRLGLALPLVCVVVVGALFVGDRLRAARGELSGGRSEEVGPAAAAPAATPQQPLQVLQFPVAVVPQNVIASPDGRHLVARTADWTKSLLLRVRADPGAARLVVEVVSDMTDLSLDAWLPDGSGFVAHVSVPLPPRAGAPAKSKTYDAFIVATDGSRTALGEVQGGGMFVSRGGAWISALDGDNGLMALARDGSTTKRLTGPIGGLGIYGWDADTRLVHQSYTPPIQLHRVGLDGAVTTTPLGTDERAGGMATWSPDHRAALLTLIRGYNEMPGLLTDALRPLPAGAFQTWVGPHELLWRAADGRVGMLDALAGATRTLATKMKSDKVRVLAASLPYVLWIDEAARLHVTDLAADRDTTLGLSPLPERAQSIGGGRFLLTRASEVSILDGAAWFRQIPATPSPIPIARDQSGVPAGYVRAESIDGGWSLAYPKTWIRRAQPMRGSDFLSYEPDLDFSGNLPPAGEARVVVQLMPNFDGLDPRAYAQRETFVGRATVTGDADVTIAGQRAYTASAHQSQPAPWPEDARYWFVRSPYFADRMLVIQALPATARARDVDAIVASLRFAAPVATPVTPITRAQVTAKYATAVSPVQRVDRVDAKLVSWKEYEHAAGGFRSYVNDPEQLVWLVVVTGEVVHPRGGPPSAARNPPATPATYPWVLFIVDAVSGDPMGLSCCGPDARPNWFDGLNDRAK